MKDFIRLQRDGEYCENLDGFAIDANNLASYNPCNIIVQEDVKIGDYLKFIEILHKNKSAFKYPDRKHKVKSSRMKKEIDIALKRLTKADIAKYFKD